MEKVEKQKISVLIPTMNRPESLKRTLYSYCYAKVKPDQIVVVDQSIDKEVASKVKNTVKEIVDCFGVECIYAFLETPSSTKARNIAFEKSKNEIVVFSDDDVDVNDDTIENLLLVMQDESIAMVAGIDDQNRKSNSKIGYFLGTKSFRKRKIGHVTKSILGRYPSEVAGAVKTEWAMGYFFAVRRKCLIEWDIVWDEKLTGYAYAEDLDFTHRYWLKAHNERLVCILSDKVRVKHLVSREYRVPSKKETYAYVVNRFYLASKWGKGIGTRISIRWTNLWILLSRVLKKEDAKVMFNAIIFAEKKHNEISKGILDY